MSLLPEIRDQLRDAAARQADGPPEAPRRRHWRSARTDALAVAVSAALIAGVAAVILSAGHGRPSSPHLSLPRTSHHGSLGGPPRQELRYLTQAFVQAANRSPTPCPSGPPWLPVKTHSQLGRALLSTVGVLRRARTRHDGLPATLQGLGGGSIYIDYVRRARVSDGVSYYVVPVTAMLMSNTYRFPGCYPAIRSALKADLPRVPVGLRAATLALEAKQASEQRRLERLGDHPGVCLVEASRQGQAASCGDTLSQLKRFGLISWIGVLAGIVPDGVASVTVEYPSVNGRPAQTATSRVIGNVFVTPTGGRGFRTLRPAMIWRAADGAIIRKIPSIGSAGLFAPLKYAAWCSDNEGSGFCGPGPRRVGKPRDHRAR